MEETRRFRIGYALAPKKQQSFIQPTLVNLARERGIDLVPIDTACPLSEQGPFDCVLHKVYGEDWKAELENYAAQNPSLAIIDQPSAIQRLHNRISMLQVVSELRIRREKETFGIPSQIVIYDAKALADCRAFGALRFPIIAKPLVADGSAKSHKMSLVYHRDWLLNLKPPLVLQEFVNHGGVIFKVYVVGDYVKCVKRKSLPDVPLEKLDGIEGSLSFLRGLRQALKLNLFNFDVIRDSNAANRYFVIDINYFPGYAKMPSYETVLTDFFWNVVNKRTDNDDVDSISGGKEMEKKG
ncbi:hypothetical protein HPP92_014454 [Vanilla planifolia]|uniref:Inositol-tetrakisphosphate 1-kinase n=1 Tax=Vanilla planifolia TaxID=51239 RepID=A0A835QUH0_VANPL|nr:hypothetical protein HPP92_014454 [Vanilla planifolia]